MKTLDLIRTYYKEDFFIIPLQKDSKVPLYKAWNEKPLTYQDILDNIRIGNNIGIVGGYQSRKNDMDLCILDFDKRFEISQHLDYYRDFKTWIQFTPKGFHVFLRMKELDSDKINNYLKQFGLGLKDSHRTTLNPHHEDNTFDGISQKEHDEFFVESIRWNSMYVVACPSKVKGKSYWFLDDCKGEILELK